MDDLSDLEKQILDFEHGRWIHAGVKDTAILETFGMTPVRYQQWVLTIIDKPAALVHDPMLVKRLRRLREQRAFARTRHPSGRRLG